MKYKAVIFDLFGTLVGDIVGPPAMRVRAGMAKAVSISADDFNRMWSESYYARNTGAFSSVGDNVIHICKEMGVQPKDEDVKLAAKIRQDLARKIMMKPRAGAIETLSKLIQMGLKTGLISNCDPDAPVIWPDTPFRPLFDTAVFSSSSGCKKPESQIYEKAVVQLNVSPENCLYIGDGSSNELTGAAEAGMHPVLIRDPGDAGKDMHRINFEGGSWQGPVITSLKEVLDLIE